MMEMFNTRRVPIQKICFALAVGILLISCNGSETQNPLKKALSSKNPKIKKVMDSLDQYEVQIRYTQIDRKGDKVVFTDFDFQVDDNQYFYPASTVKFPAAIAAFEKINEIDSLTIHTQFYVEGDSIETTFAKAISEIFAVSDNAANNRLIEFLGQDDLNQRIMDKGVGSIRVAHRLSTSNADELVTKPLLVYLNDTTTTSSSPIVNTPPIPLDLSGIEKGQGFYASDSLYMVPFDFSLKNYYPISSQHSVLKRIIFPESFPVEERFKVSKLQLKTLREAMHTLPKELGYDKTEYYDSYVKFLMFGDVTQPMPEYIKIYNKVGYAYGTLTDCAYIHDIRNNVEFMVTATILVNKDGIFDDDAYEYDEIGIPFLAQLGRELYNLELKR